MAVVLHKHQKSVGHVVGHVDIFIKEKRLGFDDPCDALQSWSECDINRLSSVHCALLNLIRLDPQGKVAPQNSWQPELDLLEYVLPPFVHCEAKHECSIEQYSFCSTSWRTSCEARCWSAPSTSLSIVLY